MVLICKMCFITYSTGLAIVGFEQAFISVIEDAHDAALVYSQITIPSGKELGCDVTVSFIASDGTRARKNTLLHTLLCFCFTNTILLFNFEMGYWLVTVHRKTCHVAQVFR